MTRETRTATPAEELANQHGGWWGEHPEFRLEDWQYTVAEDDTRLGYWEWVLNEQEAIEREAAQMGQIGEEDDGA